MFAQSIVVNKKMEVDMSCLNLRKSCFLALGICGTLAFLLTYKCRKYVQQKTHRQEKKLRKTEMHTWEGEGGNLPPAGFSYGDKPHDNKL